MSHGPEITPFAEAHDRAWYRRAFQSAYLGLYAHRNEADARRAVAFLHQRMASLEAGGTSHTK